MANTDINLSPYTAESEAIARRMKMAELLQQQAMQPLEAPGMAGGYQLAVSPYAGLAKILQGYTAGQAGRSAEAERKALGERYQSDLVSTLNRANELSFGKPAIAEQAPVTQIDDEGYPNPVVAGSPAVAPNPEAAAREYFKHPATQAMGMNQLQKIAQTQQFINAGNAPPNTSVTNAGVTPATSTSGSAVVSQVGSQQLASALTGFGGPAGGQPMKLYLQTDPTGKSYLEQLVKDFTDANKPTDKIRELRAAGVKPGTPQWNAALTNILTAGGIYQPNEEGGVGLAKGFVAGAGDIKRAEEEAKAENEVVTRTVGGREVLGTNKQFRILATGNAPTDAEARNVAEWADRNSIKVSIKFPSTVSGTPQGASGGGAPGPASSVRNPTASDSTYSGERAKSFATMADKIGASWEIATKMNGMLDQLDLLYQDPNVTSGALAENISGLKGLAASLNIDIAGRGSEEAIQSITNRFALELRNPSGGAGMPGAMSDADRTFLSSIPPGLSKTPAGRALIAQGMRSVNDRDRQIANMAQRYEERVGRLDNGFIKEMREWSDANPLLSPQVKSAMQELMRRTK